ncbi:MULTISPECIES: tail fiber domain-containing protein [Enterobacteriaceae]|nr:MULTISPECIES: tail fiber domain-containing protein [Enterobacteriaceae]KTH87041.1 phage tail protein [Enterobacter hormaechei subsp. xiangfangensis]MDR9982802.1 tail fiber domain-containing protein [Enterobacter hormaechei subsp. steigerwaltii]MDS0063081.1 tail fiber domain-containing protein [Enterobacter cloacae subsp. cloacae]
MWYREGTITFTQGSDTLEGTGTFWNVTANGVLPGMIVIGPDNKLYEIKRVLNDTRLTLMEQYSGETQNDVPCRIITTYEGDLTQFSARFTALMTRMSADSKTMRSWLTAIDEVTLEREDGTEVTVKSLTQIVNEHNANQQWYRDNTDAIDAAGDKAKQAAASAAAAANSASTAGTKATEASKSAAAAAASESVASEAAKGAKTSETNAESYKETAVASAATATEKAAEAGASASSAAASKNAAKASETNAAGSAVSAADSATAASNSAAAAEVSESNAAASENAAAGSAAAALASQNAAKTSETNAAQSADGSAASAAAAKVSETNAAASETAAAASKVAAGLSADAAAGSATTAGEYADAAEASKDAAASSAGEAKKSEASAAASATTATDALAGIEAKATEAAESATLATAKASEASTSAAEAKASQTKAKASEDKAYEYAQNAQSSIASVKWKGTSAELDLTSDTPKWVKVSRARMPQATSTVYIEVIGGAGYDADSPGQAAMADIVLRTAGGDPKGLNAVAYLTQDSAVNSVATVNTDEENYDIYLRVGAGAQKLIVNLQFSGAAVESLEVIESVDSLPEGAVEGTVYHRVLSDINGAITGSLVGNASTATVLQTGRRIGGVLFDGSQDINLPGVNAEGNQSTSGNAGTASKLRTPRKIGGVNFDGSADINLPGVNTQGNQSTTGNAATATKLQTARKIAGVNFDGSSDINISPANINAAAAVSGWLNSGSGAAFTTAQFVTWLNEQGAFGYKCWIARCSWSYASNNYIDDTGCGRIDLSGSVIEVFSNGNSGNYTIRITTPTTTGHGGVTNAEFIYVNNGDGYGPGWRRLYNTRNKPTPADIGALASGANAVSASKLQTARSINNVAFDGTANISIPTLVSRGRVTALAGSTQGAMPGIQMYEAYNNGYPTTYGNVLHFKGGSAAGEGELLLGWSGTSGGHAPAYIRSRRDTTDANWSGWAQIYTTANKPSAAEVGALPTGGGAVTGTINQDGGAQGTYMATALCGGTTGGKKYLRKYRGGSSDTIWHETVQGGTIRWATGNTDAQEELIINTGYGVRARNEITSLSANALRAAYGNFGFFIRNDGSSTYFLLTASGDKFGGWNGLRPLTINNTSGRASMANGLDIAGGATIAGSLGLGVTNGLGGNSIVLGDNDTGFKQNGDGVLDVYANSAHVFRFVNGTLQSNKPLSVSGDITSSAWVYAGRFAINSGSGSWINMRDQNVIFGRNAVSTSSAQALLRQDHADRKFFVGGLGNSQFGFYMINNSRTANGTDAQAYLQNDGTWVCGGNGSFNDVYIRSDRRSKRNIRKIESALDKLGQIEGVLYEIQVHDRYEQSGGLIAQDVQKVQPELVTVDKNDQSGEERLRLNYNGVIGLLVEAVKELRDEIREIKENR